jgi:Na+/H+-dicarboxylate symporter/ABC-type amino acid transport substrate-binding protein
VQDHRLFVRILQAIGIGVLVGLFFGERVRPLEIIAAGFIKLLQVNVLPYLLGSLIASLGSRGIGEIKTLARYGAALLLFVWGLMLLLVMLCPLALPPFSGAPVFALDEPSTAIDWLDLYIPSNLFRALSSNFIPAVVLFGILAGLALGQIPDARKRVLLDALSAFNEAMARVSRMILALTPYGLFAIAAVTAGQIRVEDLLRLQIWFVFYAGGTLLFTLWVLPSLVARLTKVPARDFLVAMRGAIITAAAAGDALVVLPLISEAAKALLAERGGSPEDADRAVGVAVPLLYNFPHVAKILSLAFLPFAAWYVGSSLGPTQMGLLITAGPLSLFGTMNAAIPFLLDLLHLPADVFELFSISSVINARLGSMTAATHVAALGIILAASMMGGVRVAIRPMLRFVMLTAASIGFFVLSTRVVFTRVLPPAPSGLGTLASFELRPPFAGVVDIGVPGETPDSTAPEPGQRLREIKARGVLRVGYFGDAVPWSFVNAEAELVGYDIEAAHRLAMQLGVRLAFVPIDRTPPRPALELAAGHVDILMSGMTATVPRGEQMELSQPYATEHVGFLLHDFDRARFETVAPLHDGDGITIAVPPVDGAGELVHTLLPNARTRPYVSIITVCQDTSVTAVLTSLERAYYWSRIRPELAAVRPKELTTGTALVYALPSGEDDLRRIVDLWIRTRQASGEADEAYDYWIRGKALTPHVPRWSVLGDVLGWR